MRRKMMWLLLAVALLVEVLLGGGTYYFMRELLIEQSSERMEDMGWLLIEQLQPDTCQQQVDAWAQALNAQNNVYRITVVDLGGDVLADTDAQPTGMSNHSTREEIKNALSAGVGQSLRYSPTTHVDYLYVAVHAGDMVLRISQDMGQIVQMQNTILGTVLISGIVSLMVAYLLSLLATQRVIAPIGHLRDGAGRIAKGDLDYRIPPQPDELGGLAREFNFMAGALKASLTQERMQQAQLQAVLRAVPVGLIAVNDQCVISQLNPEAVRLLCLRSNGIGEALQEVIHDDKLIALAKDALLGHGTQTAEWTTDKVLHAAAAPIGDGAGDYMGVVLVLSDMTQMRRLEQMRTEFVSNATHELKTPLTAIRGCIETLRDPDIDTSNPRIVAEMLEIMDVQGERLQALIGDMLQLSEIENVPMLKGEGDLCAAVQEAVEAIGVQAKQREVSLHVDMPSSLQCRAPKERLRRIAQNLIENAVRYNRAGGNVWVQVSLKGAMSVLTVRDDGVGIPPGDVQRVCERFYRVDKDRSRNSGGTGLGLAIVKHMVRRYDGELQIDSTLGVGSVFTVTIPRH